MFVVDKRSFSAYLDPQNRSDIPQTSFDVRRIAQHLIDLSGRDRQECPIAYRRYQPCPLTPLI
jgi:hypothetical protein